MVRPSAADRFMPAALEALAAFPVSPGDVTLASYSENLTFRVTDRADGEVYALRLHRPGYNSLEELQAEFAWTQALAAEGISVPAAVLARDGRAYVEVDTPDLDGRRFASVQRWVRGRLLSSLLQEVGERETAANYLVALGAITARMHDQAHHWRPPPAFHRRRLDLDNLIGDRPVWGRFDRHPSLTDEERLLLVRTRDRIQTALAVLVSTPANFGLIHADIHPENVMVCGDRLCILDFDDAAFGWRLYDIAVGLFYLHGNADFPALQRAMLEGYRAVRALDEDAIALLPFFRVARGLVMIGWFEQRPKLTGSAAFRRLKTSVLTQCAALD